MERFNMIRIGPLRIGLLTLLLGFCCLGQLSAQTGTFIDRDQATDLRVVSYNVLWNTIFSDEDPTQAAKFERVVQAIDADIWNLQEVGPNNDPNNPTDDDVVDLMNSIMPLPGGATWYGHQSWDNVIVSKYPLTMLATDTIPEPSSTSVAMALVDLPDAQFDTDFYFMNNHFKCCGDVGTWEDDKRQEQADALVNWMRDARTPGGNVNLPVDTPMVVAGDMNIVGGFQPINTLVTGNIINEGTYGSDSPPDWDGSSLTDAHPLLNDSSDPNDDYTWRNDNSWHDPGRLDYIIYTDSVLDVGNQFVLNTVDMSAAQRTATGLQEFDITVDLVGDSYDHLPVVVDFRMIDIALPQNTWDGGGANDNWTTGANWLDNTAPNPAATGALIFDGAARLTPNVDVPHLGITGIDFAATAGAFTLGGNNLTFTGAATVTNLSVNTQTINNNLVIDGASLLFAANSGRLDVDGVISGTGGSLTKIGSGTLTLSGINTYTGDTNINSGTIRLNGSVVGDVNVQAGGTLDGTGMVGGTVNNNGGTVAPGNSAGELTLSGDYTQSASATLEIEIGGLIAGSQHDQLDIAENAVLDGTLDVSLINSFTPGFGDTFEIISATSVTGTFASELLPTLGGGLSFEVLYGLNDVTLRVILVGDLDDDGFVGITDLNLVLSNWNQNVPPANAAADPSGDGFVGIEDLNFVLGNWNAGVPPNTNASSNIPEPGSLALLGLAMAPMLRRVA
jgi:autotransporter-associated beta strand protein